MSGPGDWIVSIALKLMLWSRSRPGQIAAALANKDFPLAQVPAHNSVRVGLIQQRMYLAVNGANFAEKTHDLTCQAVKQGAQFVIFPEYSGAVLLGLLPGLDKLQEGTSLDDAMKELGGESLQLGDVFDVVAPAARRIYETTFSILAKNFGVHIATGSIILPGRRGKRYGTNYLFGPDGRLIGTQRKLHMFTSELGWVTPGNELRVFDLPFARVAIPICMDYTYWETTRIAYLLGAEIFVDPSFDDDISSTMWTRYRGVYSRVQESPAYGIHCYMVGDFLGYHLRGPSGVYAPLELTPSGDGILAEAKSSIDEEVLAADLDLAALRNYKAKHPLDFNVALYEKYLPSAYEAYR